MAYGSPRSPQDVAAYYTHMRGGRAPAPEALAELQKRYAAIGGHSPLAEITELQAQALERELTRRRGSPWPVLVAMKHSPPFLEDRAQMLRRQGVAEVVGLVLAPHYSALSVDQYRTRVESALDGAAAPRLRFIEGWHLHPGYVAWLAAQLRDRLSSWGGPGPLVIFTAHSLPARLREMGDPYPESLAATAAST
ncbi:MAG: ferrochelatase, partial [Candidatus Dormibacteria bacterium]